jgi:hypothetical protein
VPSVHVYPLALLKVISGAINRHKSGVLTGNPGRPRNNVYINPNYKPPAKTVNPIPPTNLPKSASEASYQPTTTKDVIIGGVAFESSGRSLVRKDRESCRGIISWGITVPIPLISPFPSSKIVRLFIKLFQECSAEGASPKRHFHTGQWPSSCGKSNLQAESIFASESPCKPQHDS